jgi:hypothetical protein
MIFAQTAPYIPPLGLFLSFFFLVQLSALFRYALFSFYAISAPIEQKIETSHHTRAPL